MPTEFLNYLFADLKDHMEHLKEAAYKEDPDGENVEYHFEKASSILDKIEKGIGGNS
jgi:hypothetical protein